ncbi:hypothetical protein BG015_003307 [Linnemannia schmuckeri]|uniref:Uncharacterized protein n=1 Tax=Linnemannia schmuckeri TaxID=64567 RepID=A0A9P5S389_9FUNG|nr:hypothetical protein BG015_003307 [Linnemannia schmuckeri]
MSSIIKSALLVSLVAALVVFQFASAAPQDVGFGADLDDYGLGSDMGAYGGLGGPGGVDYGGYPTHIPVSPVTIVPETDFIPINNVQPVVNVLPVNVNDFSWPPYYNDYDFPYGSGAYGGGAYGGILGGGMDGGMGGPF